MSYFWDIFGFKFEVSLGYLNLAMAGRVVVCWTWRGYFVFSPIILHRRLWFCFRSFCILSPAFFPASHSVSPSPTSFFEVVFRYFDCCCFCLAFVWLCLDILLGLFASASLWFCFWPCLDILVLLLFSSLLFWAELRLYWLFLAVWFWPFGFS